MRGEAAVGKPDVVDNESQCARRRIDFFLSRKYIEQIPRAVVHLMHPYARISQLNARDRQPPAEQSEERVTQPQRVDLDEIPIAKQRVFPDQINVRQVDARQEVAARHVRFEPRLVERVEQVERGPAQILSAPVRLQQEHDNQYEEHDRSDEDRKSTRLNSSHVAISY